MKIFKNNVANFITALGLLATIWLLLVALTNPEEIGLILILAAVIVLSDILDGFLARALKIESYLGQILDPLRDKFFICILLITLIWHWHFKFPMILETLTKTIVAVVVLNNLLVSLGGLIGLINKIDISPSIYGRRRTLCQFLGIGVWLISLAIEKYFEFSLIERAIYLINFLLLVSIYLGIKSLEDYWKRYQNSKGLRIS